MQIEINKIADWLNINKLYINTSKTKLILFRSSNKKQKHNITISINDENIKQVKNITFLTIVIDECLTWNDRLDLVAKKVIKSTTTFYNFECSKTDLLCISLSISNLRQFNMG